MPPVCRLLKGHISNILGTVLCVELKLKRLVLRDIEQTKRQYFHHITTAYTPTTTTITITSGTTATATRARGIMGNFFWQY